MAYCPAEAGLFPVGPPAAAWLSRRSPVPRSVAGRTAFVSGSWASLTSDSMPDPASTRSTSNSGFALRRRALDFFRCLRLANSISSFVLTLDGHGRFSRGATIKPSLNPRGDQQDHDFAHLLDRA